MALKYTGDETQGLDLCFHRLGPALGVWLISCHGAVKLRLVGTGAPESIGATLERSVNIPERVFLRVIRGIDRRTIHVEARNTFLSTQNNEVLS